MQVLLGETFVFELDIGDEVVDLPMSLSSMSIRRCLSTAGVER